MRIEDYFERVRQTLDACLVVESFNIAYDNSGHHNKLKLRTYPHHKHTGGEENVIESPAPELAAVLQEIEIHVQLP